MHKHDGLDVTELRNAVADMNRFGPDTPPICGPRKSLTETINAVLLAINHSTFSFGITHKKSRCAHAGKATAPSALEFLTH
jgi:hypothetical protein